MTTLTTGHSEKMRVFDADNHYYETYDSFTRYMPPKLMNKALHVEKNDNGRNIVMVGDVPLRSTTAHPQDFVAPPGSLFEMFATGQATESMYEYNKKNKMRAEDDPSFLDFEARLKFMDSEGVEAAVLYPSLAVMVEQHLKNDVEATYANLNAFNRWIEDDWGYNTEGRLFSVPLMSLLDIDQAVAELDRVLALGARAVHIRTGPVFGRSPASPDFDPFWARLDEAGVPLAMHSSYSQYHELVSVHWGEEPDPTYTQITPFQSYLGVGTRPMMDTLAAMVFHDLFGRFPNLNVMSIESGSHWLKDLLKQMDKAQMGGRSSKLAPKLDQKASEILKQHLYLAPHPEDDPVELADVIPADHIIFGSDYPHPEGLPHPVDFADGCTPLGEDATKAIMGQTIGKLLGVW